MRVRTARDLAAVARGRRLDRAWTQAHVADLSSVSRKWLSDFENGKTTVDLGLVLRLLDVLDLTLDLSRTEDTAGDPSTSGLDLDDLLGRYSRCVSTAWWFCSMTSSPVD